jgi:hypothetical protein
MPDTRGDRAIRWIQAYCLVPDGPQKGEHVKLTQAERFEILRIYNAGGPQARRQQNQAAVTVDPEPCDLKLTTTAPAAVVVVQKPS